VDDTFGLPTVTDILAELDKPGRDPRPAFAAATFSEGIEKISDLKPGMVLEGTVTNVAAFGAFVDVGVHQDGLVHVSALANRFVSDPREVVKSGQVVRVKVLEADPERKRISLTLRLDDEPSTGGSGQRGAGSRPGGSGRPGSGKQGAGRQGTGGQGSGGSGGFPGNKANAGAGKGDSGAGKGSSSGGRGGRGTSPKPAPVNTAMAEALRKAGLGK
jgi:uncharacterized protein